MDMCQKKKHTFLISSLDFDQDILDNQLKSCFKNKDYFRMIDKLDSGVIDGLGDQFDETAREVQAFYDQDGLSETINSIITSCTTKFKSIFEHIQGSNYKAMTDFLASSQKISEIYFDTGQLLTQIQQKIKDTNILISTTNLNKVNQKQRSTLIDKKYLETMSQRMEQ